MASTSSISASGKSAVSRRNPPHDRPYIDREHYLADMEWKRQLHAANGTTLGEERQSEQWQREQRDVIEVPGLTPRSAEIISQV